MVDTHITLRHWDNIPLMIYYFFKPQGTICLGETEKLAGTVYTCF